MTDTPSTPAASTDDKGSAYKPVVVRAYPKVIFFWLTWIFSLLAGIIAAGADTSADLPQHLGTIWMIIFAFNLLVISFDFNECGSSNPRLTNCRRKAASYPDPSA